MLDFGCFGGLSHVIGPSNTVVWFCQKKFCYILASGQTVGVYVACGCRTDKEGYLFMHMGQGQEHEAVHCSLIAKGFVSAGMQNTVDVFGGP